MSIVCIICSDPITAAADVYSTPCGHIFHFLCLCNWMERSKTCPQCRQKTSNKLNHRVFLNFSNSTQNTTETIQTMQFKMDNLNYQVNEAKMQVKKLKEDHGDVLQQNAGLRLEIANLERKERAAQSAILAFKEQIKFYKSKIGEHDRLTTELTELRRKLKDYDNIEVVVKGTRDQVEQIIRNENNIESLALITATLKKSLVESQRNKRDLEHRLKKCQNELASVKYQLEAARTVNVEFERQMEELTRKFEHAKACWDGEKADIKAKMQRLLADDDLVITEKRNNSNNDEEKNIRAVYTSDGDAETTPAPKRKRKLTDIDLNVTINTPMDEKVERIRSATSPYLPIKSSSIAIPFLGRAMKKNTTSKSFISMSQNRVSKIASNSASSSSGTIKKALSSGNLTSENSKRTKYTASGISTAKFKKLAPPKSIPSDDDDFINFN